MERRYERQLALPQVGESGQAQLKQAKVLVIGAGGLGSPALYYLAAAGVGTLGIADGDTISLSNLNRQTLYTTADIGRAKALVAAQRLQALNPEVNTIPYPAHVTPADVALLRDYDVIVEACDSLAAKALVNKLSVAAGRPLVWGSVSRFEGQMGVYLPGHACRHCIFPVMPAPGTVPTPAELGVLGASAGVIGAWEAQEAIKVLLGIAPSLVDRILLWDGLHNSCEVIAVSRDPACNVCAAA